MKKRKEKEKREGQERKGQEEEEDIGSGEMAREMKLNQVNHVKKGSL